MGLKSLEAADLDNHVWVQTSYENILGFICAWPFLWLNFPQPPEGLVEWHELQWLFCMYLYINTYSILSHTCSYFLYLSTLVLCFISSGYLNTKDIAEQMHLLQYFPKAIS